MPSPIAGVLPIDAIAMELTYLVGLKFIAKSIFGVIAVEAGYCSASC